MELLKRHTLKIILLLILVLSAAFCIYTIYNYKGSTNTQINFHNNFQGNSQGNNSQQPGQNGPGGNGFQGKQAPNGQQQNPGSDNHIRDHGQMGSASTSSNYSYVFIIYGIIFLAVFMSAYYFFVHKKLLINSSDIKLLMIALLASAFLLRIALALLVPGYTTDLNLFKNWASSAAKSITQFYSNSQASDYPPLYIYVLSIVGKIGTISAMSKYYILLLKLPSIIADIAASFFIYKIARKHFNSEIAMLLSAFYAFNPAIFINSTLWGQVDSFFALIVATSVYLLSEKKIIPSTILFTAAVLMKPQGIIFLPVLFFELVRQKDWKLFVKSAVTALITAVIVILPFSINKNPLWIFSLYSGTISEYPYASLNAYNFFSLIGANNVKDTATLFIFSYHTWGMIFIVLVTLFSWYIYIKKKDSITASASAGRRLQLHSLYKYAYDTFSVG